MSPLTLAKRFVAGVGERFWVVPALITVFGIVAAEGLVVYDRSGLVPSWLIENAWVYSGGATGARTLLGAVASSTIGVAGTVFSITIAALSLAAGQMGPRLLRNFTHDRGNQVTLGVFLGTFCYALMVLRSVRTANEGEFIPHVSLSVSIVLAFLSVATLVYFVGHMAGRINVDTVIELVSSDVRRAIERLTNDEAPPPRPSGGWSEAMRVTDARQGYVQAVDADVLADWAAAHRASIRLLVRPGDFVFPGSMVAVASQRVDGLDEAVVAALALGPERVSDEDLEYPIRQLVEVAVRALSPGINDPHTAVSVLDRLGAALCEIVGRHLPDGVAIRDGVAVLVAPSVHYDGLTNTMFHMIRQNARAATPVLIRLMEVLTAVAACERDAARLASLQRHAALVMSDAERRVETPSDLADLRERYVAFDRARCDGAARSRGGDGTA